MRGIDWRTVDWARLEARDAAGAFSGLVRDTEYWAVVVEDGAERARYEREQAARAAAFAARAGGGGGQPALLREDRQLSLESCSCIEGTPCATPECCLDFAGRFENARRVMEDRKVRKALAAAAVCGIGGGGGGGAVDIAEKERQQCAAMDKLGGHSYKKL